jgi:hypothetical protein
VDLRAKLLRSQSLLDALYDGKDPNTYKLSRQEQDRARRQWIGETVIYKIDKKTYSIVDLVRASSRLINCCFLVLGAQQKYLINFSSSDVLF